MDTRDKIHDLRGAYTQHHGRVFDRLLSRCDSPVEQLFLAQLLLSGWERPDCHHWLGYRSKLETLQVNASVLILISEGLGAFAAVQVPLFKYRIDFVFLSTFDPTFRLAVEIDGHDFHDRTPRQASRDRARDRFLTRRGWTTVRFTGSDVHQDVASCCSEVEQIIIGRTAPDEKESA